MTFDQVLVEQAKEATSVEEIMQLAKESGIELNAEEAEQYYAQLHTSGELSDDELENVSGGGCGKPKIDEYTYRVGDCVSFDTGSDIEVGNIIKKTYFNGCGKVMYRIELCRGGTFYWVDLSQIKEMRHQAKENRK